MITSTIINNNYTLTSNKRVAIGLRTKGCSWAKTKNGPCIHCAIHNSEICSNDYDILFDTFIKDFAKYDFEKINALTIFTPGSFFDKKELPIELRNKILKIISNNKNIKEILFESLPEYITEENMAFLKKIFPNKNIIIGIGLDEADDFIRKRYLNKSFKYNTYAKACDILKRYSIFNLTYILVKPPYVTEKEAIINAIESTQKAFYEGANIVSLEIMNIQKGTKVFELYKNNEYKPPWLWTIIEILKRVSNFGLVKVGLFNYPNPYISSQNCEICTNSIINEFQLFNIKKNVEKIKVLDCTCKKVWSIEVKK